MVKIGYSIPANALMDELSKDNTKNVTGTDMNLSETQEAIVGIEAVLVMLTTAVAAQNGDPKKFVTVVRDGVEDVLKAKGLELGCELKTAEETADYILRSTLKSVEQMKPIPE